MTSKRQKTETGLSNGTELSTQAAQSMLDFINYAWTPFHAVEEASKRLVAAGFQKLSERQAWSLQPGGRYFFTRNMSTIVAFAVGAQYKPGNGFHMLGAHTDSPCLKLKPRSKSTRAGYDMVNVEPYGGGLWHTWFDRDLSLAGRVLVRSGEQLVQKLVKCEMPLMHIPMLAIHLHPELREKGFNPNKQTHLGPILAVAAKHSLDKHKKEGSSDSKPDSKAEEKEKEEDRHHKALLQLLSTQLGCSPDAIVDFELHLCDVQPSTLGGIEDEFVFSGRLDNLAMSFCSLQALLDAHGTPASLADASTVKAVALFDHEEVGSSSAQGAGGPVMRDTITRVASVLGEGSEGAVVRALQSSFLVSADMAHAVHPNYADKHDGQHQPKFGQGIVIKHNVNQRYATNSVSSTLFREVARRHGIPTQDFAVRSDMACGSTIGPILASGLGCRTVDVGLAQLAMHSIREMSSSSDVGLAIAHFTAFFREFERLDASIDIDGLAPPVLQGTLEDTPCNHVH
ncbi:hypothetical protein WJX74_001703 [Apatococcus lobatus]|uniref:aspartyl aminopeptidase n=1 Tax=Apatococcus lobatus TaxID=904363 RepID=A0AAW1RT20_9CHLO